MNGIQQIAAKGRYGDNHLLHVSDAELQGLNALANEKFGRGLTTNPDTGLPEAFLFAPLLAPALMGAAGGALGTGALATGLVAGGLGAAEAAARGMDDPLQQGLMAGLTAGAGSAIGSSLQGAAEGAQAANVGIDQATLGAAKANAARMTELGINPDVAGKALSAQYGVDAANLATQAPQGMLGGMQQSFEGAKAIATGAPGAPTMGQFIKQNQMPLAIGAAGISGQQQLGAQQEMRERKEAMDQEKAAELKATQDIIRRNYANVGRALPMNPYTNRPVFAEGGIVGLMGGGRPFDSAPRYLETGGMLGDGMSDDIPATIDGTQPAALSDGEFVVPADVVSHLGNGSSDAGAKQLYSMMDRIRQARTGTKEQAPEINAKKYMPA